MATHIIKRHGHDEKFDPRKVYASVYAACRNAHLSEIQSEKIAEAVSMRLTSWMKSKTHVDSSDVFAEVINILREIHPDVAFMYETHRDLS